MCLANIAREIKRLLEPRPTISQYRGEQLIVGPVARRISSLPSPFSSPDECGTRAKRRTMRSVRIDVAQRRRYNGVPRLLCNCASLEY